MLDRCVSRTGRTAKTNGERRAVTVVAVICAILVAGYLIAALFAPWLRYRVMQPPAEALNSPQYLSILEALVDVRVTRNNRIEVLTNGGNSMRQNWKPYAMRSRANIEAYIFQGGRVTRQFVDALFAHDLSQSKEVTYKQWTRRPIGQRIFEWAGLLVQRQQ